MSERDQPFDGIKVVEFGQFVAVPFCAQLLAEGGARVIKVEAPEGDPTRQMGQLAPGETRIFISRNRGKHSLPLHLRSPGAPAVIEALLRWADVVLMNFRPGLAADLGLDPAGLTARYPRIIVGEITPFGKRGPDAGLAAMDIVVQARSGLMAANGRVLDGRPAPGDPVSSDYMSAMMLAFGVSSALLRRERTGRGGIVDVSLMQAAMTLENNQLIRAEDRDRDAHAEQLERLAAARAAGAGWEDQVAEITPTRALPMRSVYFRTYGTADGTIAIACASRGLQVRFSTALGFEDRRLADPNDRSTDWPTYYRELQHTIEAQFRSRPSAEWVRLLNDAGVPVSTVKFPLELFDDPQADDNGMFQIIDHPTAGKIKSLSAPVGLDRGGFVNVEPTPAFGSETRSLLAEVGFSATDIDRLLAGGVTNEGP